MQVTVAPELMEKSVVQELHRRKAAGDSELFDRYVDLIEELRALDADLQEAALRSLHHYFFHRLGFADLVPPILSLSPSLNRPAEVCEASGAEGASFTPDGRMLRIEMMPGRFADPEASQWLQRALACLSPQSSPCPLCAFPTDDWILHGRRLTRRMIARIRRELPRWSPEDGLCSRCAVRAGRGPGPWWVQAS